MDERACRRVLLLPLLLLLLLQLLLLLPLSRPQIWAQESSV